MLALWHPPAPSTLPLPLPSASLLDPRHQTAFFAARCAADSILHCSQVATHSSHSFILSTRALSIGVLPQSFVASRSAPAAGAALSW